jgi:hypothetical protein
MRRGRFYVEVALAGLTGALTILTLITREWIEAIFRVDPDGGNGSLEWAIVAGLAVACVALSVTAWRESLRPAPASS